MRSLNRTRALAATVTFTATLLALAFAWAATALAVDPGSPLWTRTYGGAQNQEFLFTAACPGGDVVVLGLAQSTIDRVVVARYSPSGARRWLKIVDPTGTSTDDYPVGLGVDGDGNALLLCSRRVDAGASQYLVCKYRPNGRRAWKRALDGGAGGLNTLYDLALGASGDAYVTGVATFAGPAQGSLTARLRARDGKVVMRCALTGVNTLGSADSLVVDGSGNAYVTGSGDRGDGRAEMVTAKIRPNGTAAWMREIPAAGTDRAFGQDIVLATGGRLYVVGTIGPMPSRTFIVVRYSTAGVETWRDTYDVPGGSMDTLRAVTTDRYGNLFVAGAAMTPGPSPSHACIIRWTPSKARWAYVKPSDDTSSSIFGGVVADQAGGCWVGGGLTLAADTDDDTGTMYAARVSRSGALRWEQVQVRLGRHLSGNGLVACKGGLAMPGSAWSRVSSEYDAVITMIHR